MHKQTVFLTILWLFTQLGGSFGRQPMAHVQGWSNLDRNCIDNVLLQEQTGRRLCGEVPAMLRSETENRRVLLFQDQHGCCEEAGSALMICLGSTGQYTRSIRRKNMLWLKVCHDLTMFCCLQLLALTRHSIQEKMELPSGNHYP